MWRYLFHDDLVRHYNFVASVNLPYAPHFWEVVHDLHLGLLEKKSRKTVFRAPRAFLLPVLGEDAKTRLCGRI